MKGRPRRDFGRRARWCVVSARSGLRPDRANVGVAQRSWPIAGLLLAAGAALTAALGDGAQVLVNVTASEPPGVYLQTTGGVARGRLVAFAPPVVSAQVEDGRLTRFHSFLKEVAAVGGDKVCSDGRTARAAAGPKAPVAQNDGRGRPLPHWLGCRRLEAGEVFVMSTRVRNSFDSRYFGPIPLRSVIGVYRPLWTHP